jgi:hypothetical protein
MHTGYPLSPMPVRVFGVTVGMPSASMAWFLDRPGLGAYELGREWASLSEVFALPGGLREGLGLLTLPALIGFPFGLARLLRRRPMAGMLVAAVALAVLAFYYAPGASLSRILWPSASSRFLLPLVALAAPVSLLLSRRFVIPLVFGAGFYALNYVHFGWAPREHLDVLAVGSAVAAIGASIWLLYRHAGARTAALAGALLVVLGLVRLDALQTSARAEYLLESFQLHPHPKYWAPVVPLVDDGARHIIALTAGARQDADHWFSYYFLGRRLRNELVHVRAADPEAWWTGLVAARVTEVMSFAPASQELRWMEAAPQRFRRLAGDEQWGLYKLAW